MKTDDLIQTLVADARPVRRLPDVERRYIRWISFALLIVVAGVIAWGLRPDLTVKANQASFLLENAVLLVVFGSAARSAFQLSVPGDERPRSTLSVPLLAFLLWLVLLLIRQGGIWGAHAFALETRPGLRCILRISALGIIPAAVCFILLRRAAPLKKAWTGFFLSLSAFSAAAVGTQALCVIDRPLHVFLWHLLPVLGIGLLGAGVGKLAFRKRNRS